MALCMLSCLICFALHAQQMTAQLPPLRDVMDEDQRINLHDTIETSSLNQRERVNLVGWGHGLLAGGTLVVLNQAWYAGYPRSSFHFFNDNSEWLQMDKVGHVWSAYHQSRLSFATWQWAGVSRRKQLLLGGMSGVVFQGVIETLDGFSSQWGWSWGDFSANVLGSGLFVSQQLLWNEQRIGIKWGFYSQRPEDMILRQRYTELYGSTLAERLLKDYNGQTYWLSLNMRSFMKESRIPVWLNVAIGYGADGMWGARENKWVDAITSVVVDRSDIARVRQFYLSPDIDFTRIPTDRKWLKKVFFALNAFKLPAPALEYDGRHFKINALSF